MKVSNILLYGLLAITTMAQAKINIAVSVLRSGGLNLGSVAQLDNDHKPVKVFQDNSTYIEAELMSDNNDTPIVRFTIASKNESGAFIVRGMPQLATALVHGLGIASMQCEGKGEVFTLMLAVSKS